MRHFRKTFWCFVFLFAFFSSPIRAQYIYNFSSHNFLQYNPAYAGQDTNHTFFLGSELHTELLKPKEERFTGYPYTVQFSYAGNFKKFKSGLGAIGSIHGVGVSTKYDVGIMYNFNFLINENSNLRAGLKLKNRTLYVDLSNVFYWDMSYINSPPSQTVHEFNMDFGVWYSLNKFNFGFSYQNFIDSKSSHANSSPISFQTMYDKTMNTIFSYEFVIAGPLQTKPSVILESTLNRRRNYSNFLLANSFILDNVFIFGLGYMIRPQSSTNGPLYLEAGTKAGKHVQAMLGYSNSFTNKTSYSSGYFSAMVKVNF